MRNLVLSALLTGVLIIPQPLLSAGAPGPIATSAIFLDLPDGFGWSSEEDDPTQTFEFYHNVFEGNAVFFCLDRSSSMGQTTTGGQTKFAIMKREVIRALQGLTSRSVATVHFYDETLTQLTFGDPPLKMDGVGKARMIQNVSSTQISRGSCMCRGLEKLLTIANKTKNDQRLIILVADGRTHCRNGENDPNRVFQRIMAKNIYRIPINAIYTGPQSGEDWTIGKPLLERLARATGGTFSLAG